MTAPATAFRIALLVSITAAGTAAQAQRAAPLPDRPVSRAEIVGAVKRQFDTIDTNRDGAITRDEFDAYRRRQDAGTAAAPADGSALFAHVGAHWFDRADADADGRVTLAEAQVRPLHLFDMADTDHDGTISIAEQKTALMILSLRGK